MRSLTLAFLFFLSVNCLAQQQQPDPPKPKTDHELILGTWMIVGLESSGNKEPEKNYKWNQFIFSSDKGNDKVKLREGGFQPIEFNFALDSSKTTKTIDLTTNKGITIHGIYKLDGDDLMMCVSVGGQRPTEFVTKPNGDSELFTLKRSPWEKYVDKAFGFTVDIPGKKVDERTCKVDTPVGKVECSLLMGRSEMERLSCTIASCSLPEKFDEKSDKGLKTKDLVKKAILDELAIVIIPPVPELEREFIRANTYLLLHESTINIEVPGSKEKNSARIRTAIVEDKLYLLVVTGVDERVAGRSADRFLNTFSPTPPRKRER